MSGDLSEFAVSSTNISIAVFLGSDHWKSFKQAATGFFQNTENTPWQLANRLLIFCFADELEYIEFNAGITGGEKLPCT